MSGELRTTNLSHKNNTGDPNIVLNQNGGIACTAPYNQVGLSVAAGGSGYSNIAEFNDAGNNQVASIGGDGSATFADGNFKVYDNGSVDAFRAGNSSSDPIFNALSGANFSSRSSVASINADGSATLAGPITLGAEAPDSQGSTYYATAVDLRRDDGGAVYNVFKGGNSLASQTISLRSDGSSQFMGQLQISSATIGNLTEKVLLHENGWIRAYHSTNTAAADLYLGYSNVNGNGTLAFSVTTGGFIQARSTSISQIGSERRLKNTIEPLDAVTSWETIRDLPYYSYKLNGNDEGTYYGPIVDECPEEMIVEGKTSDEEGNIRTYDNSLLQGRLFVALQTALTRIEALEAEVQSLKQT